MRAAVTLAVLLAVTPDTATARAPITAVAFAPEGRSIVAASQAGVVEYDWPARAPVRQIECSVVGVHDLAFSPNGETLAAAGGDASTSGEVALFDWSERRQTLMIRVQDDVVYAATWRADSAAIAAASFSGRVELIDLDDVPSVLKSRTLDLHAGGVLAVEYLSPDLLLSGGVDATIRVWNPTETQARRTFSQHSAAINDLAVRPRHEQGLKLAASASADSTVRFWQPEIGRLVRFARLTSEPLAIAWSTEGDRLFAACRDGCVRAVDPNTTEVALLPGGIEGPAYALAVAPTGEIVVGGRGGLAEIAPD